MTAGNESTPVALIAALSRCEKTLLLLTQWNPKLCNYFKKPRAHVIQLIISDLPQPTALIRPAAVKMVIVTRG